MSSRGAGPSGSHRNGEAAGALRIGIRNQLLVAAAAIRGPVLVVFFGPSPRSLFRGAFLDGEIRMVVTILCRTGDCACESF